MNSKQIRVRFAPSPTGYVHIGSLRTALFNYLFARKNEGVFILRIEDTDRNRYVEGAVENLIDTLNWCGLDYDEGPIKGGDFGPYFQSQRLDIYKEMIKPLLESNKAYYCFCSQERLNELRKSQEGKDQVKYDKHCLNLSKEEVQKKLEAGEPYVIRLNVPENQVVVVNDLIRGDVEFNSNVIDDQVLIKSDGYPTYHFANVVDDYLMKVSHVIRGEEWLPSTPKHVLLYDYFGWEKPYFAHLPLLLNPDRSKLSKRQGDVAVEDYRKKGYLKEALINFVALLGWNPGTDQEFFYINELIEQFSLEGVNKSGAIFNIQKLDWLNFQHLKRQDIEVTLRMLKNELQFSKYSQKEFSDEYLKLVIGAMIERVNFVKDFFEKSPYFFEPPQNYDENVTKKRWSAESPNLLNKFISEIEKLENPTKEDYEKALKSVAEENKAGVGKLIHPLRLAVSGMGEGPGVYDILFILGKEEVIRRIKTAIEKIK